MRATAVRTSLLVTPVLLLLVSCQSGTSSSDQSCGGTERAQFEKLEPLVSEVLSGEQIQTRHLSSCEETGKPGATLIAESPDWSSVRQATDLLTRQDWRRVPDDPAFVSPDGAYQALRINLKEPDGSTTVMIYFSTS